MKTKTLLVKAAHSDRPCPMVRTRRRIDSDTGRDRTMIYADEAIEVPNIRFYRRRILKGDLIVATASRPQPAAPRAETKPRTSETE